MTKNTETSKPKIGGLFSGVGGIELAFEKSGFETAWANEIDSFACTTYRENFSHELYEQDIKKLNGNDLETVDVLCGGFPCQAFSVAGYRKGFEDDRGNIFFEIIRLVNELETKPKVLFLENVKNFKSHDKGNTFRTVVQIINDLGYSVFDDVLNTCDYTSIPQNRERTFLICFRGEHNWNFSEDNFSEDSDSMSYRFSELFPPKKITSNKPISDFLEKEDIPERFYYRSDRYMYEELVKAMKSEDTVYQWRRMYVRENKSNQCPTLTANMGTGGHNVPLVVTDNGFRKLTPRECFNFQGFPKSFKLPDQLADSHLYKQAGNSVSVPLITLLAKAIKQVL